MALRRKQCRAHSGIFSYHPKKGRQPVSCKPEFPCDRANEETPTQMKERTSPGGMHDGPDTHPVARDWSQKRPEPLKPANPCLPLAKAAKERLTAVGWVVQGKGALDEHYWAQITASRDHETLVIRWLAVTETDIQVAQEYAMEFEKPSDNGYPDSDLHFKPEELSDSELVRMIKGMKVTWWNTIGGSKETAIIGGNVTIEHIFYANGDEDNSKRIVKFIDHGGGGFRAFHVSALLKVG